MREALLHHIWKFKLFSTPELFTLDGQNVEIIEPGQLNPNAGPDFLEAKIKIGETVWAGNVEIHVRASDFILHGHETDPNYERLILHVVYDHDLNEGADLNCPTIELRHFVSDQLVRRYASLVNTKAGLPCCKAFTETKSLTVENWLDRMMIERLADRTEKLEKLSQVLNGDLEQTFWVRLATGFGMKVNADAFETLARSISWKALAKHSDNLHQLETLLFGQAGMLAEPKDEYQSQLKAEYDFLSSKYGLEQMDRNRWKYLRLRPSNFPSVRIAQLAALIHGRFPLIMNFIERTTTFNDLKIQASEYWDSHHVFGKPSSKRKKRLGDVALRSILINSVVPFAVFLANQRSDEDLKNSWIDKLKHIDPEENSVTKKFSEVGYQCTSAYDSQALIQLHGHYCQPRNCVNCAIGSAILKRS